MYATSEREPLAKERIRVARGVGRTLNWHARLGLDVKVLGRVDNVWYVERHG